MHLWCKKNARSYLGRAFFLAAIWLAAATATAEQTSCWLSPALSSELHRGIVERVIDGDTVALQSGEKIRLLGINTPELTPRSADSSGAEPLAVAAQQALQALVASSGGVVYYRLGGQPRDRYQRLLADLYSAAGESAAAHLLERGLGWQVAFVGNDQLASCLRAAEQRARSGRLGLWAGGLYPPLPASAVAAGGFARIIGRVSVEKLRADSSGAVVGAATLVLDQTLLVKLPRKVAQSYRAAQLQALDGRRVELRGWITRRAGQWQLQLTSPFNMQAID